MSTAIRVRNLDIGYRKKSARGGRRREMLWAARDVSCDVERGEILAVIGGNGSGKTSFLQCLAGVIRPSAGTVEVTGRVASLVDATGFSGELTGFENARIVAELLGAPRSSLTALIDHVRDFSGLGDAVLNAPLRTYSAGMILRLGLGVALFGDPDVLLFDEVLAVGDEAFQNKCWDRVTALCAAGSAAVVVTHRLEQVETHCDRALVLDRGRLDFLGPTAEGLRRYLASGGTTAPPNWARHIS